MGIMEFAKKQEIKNFFEGLVQQSDRNYSLETIKAVEERFYDMFHLAEKMNKAEADAYLTACLGLYMLESYATNDEHITEIKPEE